MLRFAFLAARTACKRAGHVPRPTILARWSPLAPRALGSSRRALSGSIVKNEQELFDEAGKLWHEDKAAAYKLLQESASLGHPAATVVVGDAFFDGDEELGVEQDEAKAFEHFKTAANAQFGPAFLKAAKCHLEGRGTEQNNHSAAVFLEEGAKLGDPDACAYLGNFYYSGAAAPKDPARAAELYLAALSHPDCAEKEQAERNLFRTACYLHGNEDSDFRPEPVLAFELFNDMLPYTTAPIKGQCLYMIASSHAEGKGAEVDDDLAYDFMERSAEEGCDQAIETLQNYEQEYPEEFEEEAEIIDTPPKA